ncbi:uncharacterized protein LOC143084213 [Mytilus galloprovincialis]|uniref:uncharacterized protein LOC143084213 n=1 Tax=Mytilus galloprovincialis TaxID=29158 RepID=UPI003F7B87AD
MSSTVYHMSFICTFLLNVLVVHAEAKISTGYHSNRNYTWKEAKNRCKMIGLLDKIQVPHSEGQLGWVDASVEYSPWVEYQNCLYVKSKFIDKHTRVTYGEQLQQCLHFCGDYNYIGLQQNNCSCLSVSEIGNTTVEAACNQKETCRGDKYAYCSYHVNDSTSQNNFVVYKKGN